MLSLPSKFINFLKKINKYSIWTYYGKNSPFFGLPFIIKKKKRLTGRGMQNYSSNYV